MQHVYKLFDNENLVYIGMSEQLDSRIRQHLGEKKFTRVYAVQVPNKDIASKLEMYLICKYKPPLNSSLNLRLAREGEMYAGYEDYMEELNTSLPLSPNKLHTYLSNAYPTVFSKAKTSFFDSDVDVYTKRVYDDIEGILFDCKVKIKGINIKCYYILGSFILRIMHDKNVEDQTINTFYENLKQQAENDIRVAAVVLDRDFNDIPIKYTVPDYFSGMHLFDESACLEFINWLKLGTMVESYIEDNKKIAESYDKLKNKIAIRRKSLGFSLRLTKYKYLADITTDKFKIRVNPYNYSFRFKYEGVENYSRIYPCKSLDHLINTIAKCYRKD